MTYNEMRATELLEVLFKFGFDKVMKDFTRSNYEDWIRDTLESGADVSSDSGISDCYIFSDGNCDVYIAGGASKVAFWTDESDSVFKMGFNKLRCDYCGLEAEYFAEAKRLGLDEFFAGTEFVMYCNGIRIYKAERAEVSFEKLSSDLFDKLKSDGMDESTIYDTIDEADSCCEFINWLLPYYTNEDKVNELFDFLNENSINDLHSGNIGYIGDRIVLIDYSGYRG